jgi:PhnB protein
MPKTTSKTASKTSSKRAKTVATSRAPQSSPKSPAPKKSATKAAKSASQRSRAVASSARAKAPRAKAPRAGRRKVAPIPAGYHTATATLIVSPCAEALEFYTKAFGAKVRNKMEGPGGVIMHAEIKIGDSVVMCSDEMPEMPGYPANRKSPKNAGATTGGVMLFVKDVDAVFDRAVAAGATPTTPPEDMFWGDRYAQVEDPYGHVWAVGTHIKDVSLKEIKQAIAQMGAPSA